MNDLGHDLGRCRRCPAIMRWALTAKGKRIPLDPDPDTARGNIRLTEHATRALPAATTLGGAELDQARIDGEDLYVSHFATCPEGPAFRKGRKR